VTINLRAEYSTVKSHKNCVNATFIRAMSACHLNSRPEIFL